jgi:hypothetical protein
MSDVYGASPSAPAAAPPSVLNAVKLMFGRAALSLVGVLATLTSTGALRDQIRAAQPTASTSVVDAAVTAGLVVAVVFALVFVVLYVLLALQVRKGKSWARIVTFVVAGLSALSFLVSLAQPASGLARAVAVVAFLLDVGIIFFLAQKPSAEYFRRPATVASA